MFQSLSDQQQHANSKELLIRVLAITAISGLLFAALYFGIPTAG